MPKTGIRFPLKEEYDRVNHTLAGLKETAQKREAEESFFAMPRGEVTAGDPPPNREVVVGDRWVSLAPGQWLRTHTSEKKASAFLSPLP